MIKLILSIITPVFSVTWSFRNHSDMLFWCSRNIVLLQLWKPWYDMSLNINYIKFLYKKLFCIVTITLLKDAYGILTDGFAVTVRTRCDDLEQQDVRLQTYACERRLSHSETPPLVQSVLLWEQPTTALPARHSGLLNVNYASTQMGCLKADINIFFTETDILLEFKNIYIIHNMPIMQK